MPGRLSLPALPILLSLFVLVPAAHAEPIPWSYAGQVTLTGPASSDYESLSFSNLSGTGAGSQHVGAFAVTLYEDQFSHYYSQATHPFDVNFRITDSASGQSGLITFHGYLSGAISPQMEMGPEFQQMGGVAGKYLNPTPPALRLGNNLYSVSISPFTVGFNHLWGFVLPINPGDRGTSYNYYDYRQMNDTSMVSVQVTSTTPEPSALVLAASGLTLLGGRLWRRRRRGQ